jgi:TonB family protein
MTTKLMAYAVLTGLLITGAAMAIELAAAALRRPRRWVWSAAMASTLLLTGVLPWRAPLALRFTETAGSPGLLGAAATVNRWWTGSPASTSDARGSDPLDGFAMIAWVAMSGLFVARYAGGLVLLRRQRRRWPIVVIGPYRVLVSDEIGPAVVGCWETMIVVPRWALQLDTRDVGLLLLHEHQHQIARDAVLIHAAEAATAVMPWNPALWVIRARLRAAIEIDCDARTLSTPGVAGPEAYGNLILTVASRPRTRPVLVGPALLEHVSILRRRILAMTPLPRRRRASFAALALAATMIAGALIVPAPALHAQDAGTGGAYHPGTPGLTNPTVLEQVKAVYTPEAKRAKIQGTVAMEGVVSVEGRLEQAHVTKSLDTKYGLDDEALRAAQAWRFRPGTMKGKPVPVAVTIEMNFTLRD